MPALFRPGFRSGLLTTGFYGCISRGALVQGGIDMNGIISGFAPPSGQSTGTLDLSGFGTVPLVRPLPAKSPFDPWLEITLGVHKTANAYTSSLSAAGYKVSKGSRAIAPVIPISPCRAKIRFALTLGHDLGLKYGRMDYREACEMGAACGLGLCPAEVGFILRSLYRRPSPSVSRYLFLAMQPILDPEGRGRILFLEHRRAGQWLVVLTFPADAEFPFFASSQFVFALPD